MPYFQRLKEFPSLFWTRLVVSKRNLSDYLQTIARYYGNAKFAKQDTALLGSYLFKSPFRISKKFLQKRGEDDLYTYGETPLTTLEQIAKTCAFTEKDTIYELGCGRGRSCFWLQNFIGCKVVGVDYVPEFIEKAQRVKEAFHVEGVDFLLEDMAEVDLNPATVIYLYGTCLEEDYLKGLAKKFAKLKPGTKLITVSYPIQDYCEARDFELMKRFPARFTWGTTDVYLQIKVKC